MVAELDVSDGDDEPVELPVVELVPAPAPASAGVFTWPAAPPDVSDVFPLEVEGVVDEVDGAGVMVPLMLPLVSVVAAALELAPVVAAMLPPDHQSREARSLGEAAR